MLPTRIHCRQPNILIVDDTPANLQVLGEMLKSEGYKVRPVTSGKLALAAAENDPPDLILLDIMMLEMDGYEVCRRLKINEKLKGIPVIFLSALQETSDKIKAFSAGGEDYVAKPFHFEEIQARVATHLKLHRIQAEIELHNHHLERLVQEQVKEITESQMSTILALAKLTESRDDGTGRHIERVQSYCRLLATNLSKKPGFDTHVDEHYIRMIFYASALHDIGKVGIPDAVLLKPGKLTDEEFTLIKQHTLIGAHTLEVSIQNYKKNPFVNMGILIAKYHHERWDGNGYPCGLKGNNIPLSARIMAVADVYDALVSERSYKKAFSHEDSCKIILADSGTQFDPAVAEAFWSHAPDFKEIHKQLQNDTESFPPGNIAISIFSR
ncbi:MAG: HD domain-containing phosphohydrolase [Betaproteobacteria bacterium]